MTVAGGILTAAAVVVLYVAAAAVLYQIIVVKNFTRQSTKPSGPLFAFLDDPRFVRRKESGAAWLSAQHREKISIDSYDGLRLCAYVYPAEGTARGTVIAMHGFRSTPEENFSSIAQFFHREGYNVIMPYERSHGESGGAYITFGIRERYDCVSWITAANERYGSDRPVFLYGVSMGSTSILMASGFTLPQNVKGLVADCGFTSPYEILSRVVRIQTHLPHAVCSVVLNTVSLLSSVFAGFSFKEYSTLTALQKNDRPVLFIHGGKDSLVPLEMTRRNYEACRAPKELFVVDDAPHAISYAVATEQYEQHVHNFLSTYGA